MRENKGKKREEMMNEKKRRGINLQAAEQENQCENDGDASEHPSAPKVPPTLAPTADSIKEVAISTAVISREKVHHCRGHVCSM